MLEKSKNYIPKWPEVNETVWDRGTEKMEGVIKRMPIGKSFGFIRGLQGIEYFFHREDCKHNNFNNFKEGDKVQFDNVDQTPKGPRAQNVVKV